MEVSDLACTLEWALRSRSRRGCVIVLMREYVLRDSESICMYMWSRCKGQEVEAWNDQLGSNSPRNQKSSRRVKGERNGPV